MKTQKTKKPVWLNVIDILLRLFSLFELHKLPKHLLAYLSFLSSFTKAKMEVLFKRAY